MHIQNTFSDIRNCFLDIQNNYFGYQKTGININSDCHMLTNSHESRHESATLQSSPDAIHAV